MRSDLDGCELILPSRTLLVSSDGLKQAKALITQYKNGHIEEMTPELWKAKKVVDSTLHPGLWSCFAECK